MGSLTIIALSQCGPLALEKESEWGESVFERSWKTGGGLRQCTKGGWELYELCF